MCPPPSLPNRGPRIRSFVGRQDSWAACPDGLLPSPFGTPDEFVELFQNKTIGPRGLAVLMGAHSTSRQRFLLPSRAGAPQDSTPGIFDTLYYKETLASDAPPGVLRFPSDLALARHPAFAAAYKSFAGKGGQARWTQVWMIPSRGCPRPSRLVGEV